MTMKVDVIYAPDLSTACERPLLLSRAPAGFPSPADDYIEGKLDLNQHLIKHPAATFFMRATGDSMTGAGIHSGDLLIVDRALEPQDGAVVIAVVDGELTIKRLRTRHGRLVLEPDNTAFPSIQVTEEQGCDVRGVVTHVIHKV